MKKIVKKLLSRTTLLAFFLLLQIAVFILLAYGLSENIVYAQILFSALSIIIVIYILGKDENPMYKLSWVVPILIFPVFGGLFYLFYRRRNLSAKVIEKLHDAERKRIDYVSVNAEHKDHKIAHYLNTLSFPSYQQTQTTFLGSGEEKLESLLEDLNNATTFIFIEYFIISRGLMWQKILKVLKEKAKAGLDIKIMYDDFGSSASLPTNYKYRLKRFGFDVAVFNPMRFHLNFGMNYRDHRKIVVIDGKIGYTGGINIGDEYINHKKRFGHWQDAAIRLEGEAVWSLSLTFLENYQFVTKKTIDYTPYQVKHSMPSTGMIIPFADTPLNHELITKNIYLNLITQAQSSIEITTPYLIIDHELSAALKLSCRSGVDIKIIIPKIPDKKLVYMVTESFIPELLASGIKVYTYDPGFIHSKLIVVDQSYGMIGTANFDYRSLYLHFENSVYIEDQKTIQDMLSYFNQSLDQSSLIIDYKQRSILYKALQMILRGFAPLM